MSTSPLTTQCPNCRQLLEIRPSQLAQARGRAVCGHCHASFDALARLALQAAGEEGLRAAYPLSNELPLLMPPAPLSSPIRPLPPAGPAIGSAAVPAASEIAAVTPRLRQPAAGNEPQPRPFVPDFIRRRRPDLRRGLSLALLAMLILLGLGWLARKPLARIPVAGPGIAWFCSISGCRLPIMPDRHRLQLLARDVRASAQHPGQLAINLRLRNSAWFTQPYPVVIVGLQGRDGQTLATQRFPAETYLGHPPLAGSGLGPGGELTISLQMDDPGTTASSFTLNFQ